MDEEMKERVLKYKVSAKGKKLLALCYKVKPKVEKTIKGDKHLWLLSQLGRRSYNAE